MHGLLGILPKQIGLFHNGLRLTGHLFGVLLPASLCQLEPAVCTKKLTSVCHTHRPKCPVDNPAVSECAASAGLRKV
jgi:hypothetical protein